MSSNSGNAWTRSGVNTQGNSYRVQDYNPSAANPNAYHYSNRDNSYYYHNSDNSRYYNSGDGYSRYTAPNGNVYESSGSGGGKSSNK